jgi:hypothetical protein
MRADEAVMAEIRRAAEKLADEAPPLSTEQQLLLVSLYARYSVRGGRGGS